MRRAFQFGCVSMILAGWVGSGFADEWRSVRRDPAPQAEKPARSVKLGRPTRLGKPIAVRKSEADGADGVVQAAYGPPKLSAPRTSKTVVRAQGVDAHTVRASPGATEEGYNCGVVTEGPPCRESCFSAPKRWFQNLCSHNWFSSGDPNSGGGFNMSRGSFESDHCFDSFISPVTNPFFFEDPRSLTEVRVVAIHQKTPGDNPLFNGSNIEFFNLQARLALSERFSIVMPKLGYVMTDDDSGLSEFMIGAKYTFWRDDQTNTIAAAGLNLEIPIGSDDVFQDNGSVGVTPYITAGQKLGNFHLLGTFGYRFGLSDERSDSLFAGFHADYSFFDRIYPFVEFNWFHYTKDGNNAATNGFEGQDIFNFGSTNVSGNDVVTMAGGVRFKITEAVQAGVAYEFPLTGKDDLLDYRITADIIIRY